MTGAERFAKQLLSDYGHEVTFEVSTLGSDQVKVVKVLEALGCTVVALAREHHVEVVCPCAQPEIKISRAAK